MKFGGGRSIGGVWGVEQGNRFEYNTLYTFVKFSKNKYTI